MAIFREKLGYLHHLQGCALWTDTIRVPDHLKRAEMAAFHDLMKYVFWGHDEDSLFKNLIPCLADYDA